MEHSWAFGFPFAGAERLFVKWRHDVEWVRTSWRSGSGRGGRIGPWFGLWFGRRNDEGHWAVTRVWPDTVWWVSAEPASTVRRDAPVERLDLDAESWVDVTRGFVSDADALYDHLVATVPFTRSEVFRYDHHRPEPRMGWGFRPRDAPHPVLVDAQRILQHRYGVRFEGAGMAWYRNGSDRMAMHRDRDLRWLDDTIIVLLVLGQRRPFPLRPLSAKYDHEAPDRGAVVDLQPGHGDLMVMGGAAQRGWQHGVPAVDERVGGRISVQWRWSSRRGRMERGGSYSKPLRYGR